MTVQTVAADLGIDVEDVVVVAVWIADQSDRGDLGDVELDRAVRAVLDPDGERIALQRSACPGCGRLPGPYLVLLGWHPCRCGGHRTTRCRTDTGGCGHDRFEPALTPTCADPAFGFAPSTD